MTERKRSLPMNEHVAQRGRVPTGELRKHSDGYSARVRYQGERVTLRLEAAQNATEAEERTQALAALAHRLRSTEHKAEGLRLLEMAGRARAGKAWEAISAAVEALGAGAVEDLNAPEVPTFATFAKKWTDGDLHLDHPDHVPAKDSTRDEQVLAKYINPVIGEVPISAITLRHAEQVMAGVPADKAPATRKLIAQALRRVLSLAVYPGRYLAANPIGREWMPKVPSSAKKAKSYLYPDEDRALLTCPAIPMVRRLAYGILAREGMRASELGLLDWAAVDLSRGLVRLDSNKTDDPRAWALSPDVVAALAAWRKAHPREERVLAEDGIPLDVTRLAEQLREDLATAGVTRAELFERSATRQPIRAHDLRATFITTSLANGRTETWVSDRTGHRSSQMINLYRRQARSWAELHLGELVALNEALSGALPPGCPLEAPPARIELAANGLGRLPADLAPPDDRESRRKEAPSENEGERTETPKGRQGARSGDVSEADLEAALVRAVMAGDGPTVEVLRVALARRQAERVGSNVVAIKGRRR